MGKRAVVGRIAGLVAAAQRPAVGPPEDAVHRAAAVIGRAVLRGRLPRGRLGDVGKRRDDRPLVLGESVLRSESLPSAASTWSLTDLAQAE